VHRNSETTNYELWWKWDGYGFFPEDNAAARALLAPGAVLVWTVDATDWNEAQSKKHEFHGWKPYKPNS